RSLPPRRLAPALPVVSTQLVLDGIDQSLPGCFDDVVGHAHGAPGLVAVARGDEDARLRAGALRLVEDAHLVVQERHLLEARVEALERLAERMIERVARTVTRGGRVLGNALDPETDGRLGHRLLVPVVLLDDDAVAVEVEVRPVVAERALHQELEGRLRPFELEAL